MKNITFVQAVEFPLSISNPRRNNPRSGSTRQQFDIARIDEQKEEILINILDEALPAVKVFKPKRLLTLLIAGFLGFAMSIPVILYMHYPSI